MVLNTLPCAVLCCTTMMSRLCTFETTIAFGRGQGQCVWGMAWCSSGACCWDLQKQNLLLALCALSSRVWASCVVWAPLLAAVLVVGSHLSGVRRETGLCVCGGLAWVLLGDGLEAGSDQQLT